MAKEFFAVSPFIPSEVSVSNRSDSGGGYTSEYRPAILAQFYKESREIDRLSAMDEISISTQMYEARLGLVQALGQIPGVIRHFLNVVESAKGGYGQSRLSEIAGAHAPLQSDNDDVAAGFEGAETQAQIDLLRECYVSYADGTSPTEWQPQLFASVGAVFERCQPTYIYLKMALDFLGRQIVDADQHLLTVRRILIEQGGMPEPVFARALRSVSCDPRWSASAIAKKSAWQSACIESSSELNKSCLALCRISEDLGSPPPLVDDIYQTAVRHGKEYEVSHEKMVSANVRLAITIARKYFNGHVPQEDLVQEGNMGLMHAAHKFNPFRGFKFSTYASTWINQYIRRYLADHQRTIRIPAHLADDVGRVRKAARALQQSSGRRPSDIAIVRETGLSLELVKTILSLDGPPVSLDSPMSAHDDESGSLYEVTHDLNAEDPEMAHLQSERSHLLNDMIDSLPDREALVLRYRFGIGTGTRLTLEETGELLGVSRERIRQIETLAIKRLRSKFSTLSQDKLVELADFL